MLVDQIKVRLKAKLQTLGVNLSNQRIDEISARLDKKVTEETEIDAKLDDYNEMFPFAELAKSDDRVRTLETQVKKVQTKPEEKKPEEQQKNDDTPDWAKALLEKVTKLETEKVQATLQEKVKSHEKLKSVPASFYKGRTLPTKEDDLESFVESVTTDYATFQQEFADATASSGGTPLVAGGKPVAETQVDADIKAWAESKKQDSPKK